MATTATARTRATRRAPLTATLACVALVAARATRARATAGRSFAIAMRRRATTAAGRRLSSGGADAIEIRSYGARLGNGYGEGHEFSLTVTLPGAQAFDLVVDTGSPISYLPCVGCDAEVCGYHEHQYYDWRLSNDFRVLNASTNAADAAFCDAMPVAHNVSDDGECFFGLEYLDGARGGGSMVEDVVSVGDELSPAKMIFGCGGVVEADGAFGRQDGMAGFSRGNTAFHTQLAKAGVINAHVFGFCSEGSGTDTAMLSLGRYDFGRDLAPLSYTRILGADDLAVRTMSWKLGEAIIASSSNVYTVLDSGTTLVLLPPAMRDDFITKLVAQMAATHPELVRFDDEDLGQACFFSVTPVLTAKLRDEWFPKLTITYDPDITLILPPENYLTSHFYQPHTYCLGIEESDGMILLGQQALRNTFVEYDLENDRVGVVVAQCENLRKKFAPDTPHNPWRFVAIVFILLFTACVVSAVSFGLYAKFGTQKPFKYRVFQVSDILDEEIEMGNVVDT